VERNLLGGRGGCENRHVSTNELFSRLAEIRRSLADSARRELPAGFSEPDPGETERWDAKQVWAHMAEFVAYWQHQFEDVIRDFDGMPVPFGRVKSDENRIAAVDMGRHRPIDQLAADVDRSIEAIEAFLRRLDAASWSAQGLHPTVGVMDLPAMVDRFIVAHLEEHAEQLATMRPADINR
jgi:hypothetical protein